MIWSQTFGGIKNDLAYSLVETSDRGFVIAGVTDSNSNGQEIWLIKTDKTGNRRVEPNLWTFHYFSSI